MEGLEVALSGCEESRSLLDGGWIMVGTPDSQITIFSNEKMLREGAPTKGVLNLVKSEMFCVLGKASSKFEIAYRVFQVNVVISRGARS